MSDAEPRTDVAPRVEAGRQLERTDQALQAELFYLAIRRQRDFVEGAVALAPQDADPGSRHQRPG